MNRRTFLVRSAEVALVAAAASMGLTTWRRDEERPFDADAFAPVTRSPVTVVKHTSYERDLESVILDGIRTTGVDVRDRVVLLKPNLVEFDAGTVINTDPRVVGATVLAMRQLGAKQVTVGEGPGHRRDTDYVVNESGLFDVLDDLQVPFVDLNVAPVVRTKLDTRYTSLGELWLPRPVTDADLVVSMPKLKTHHHVGLTVSMKNCFGCVPGRVYGWPKNVLHWHGIEQSIIDVASAVRPGLVIVDGVVGMQGNGPIQGSPAPAGLLVFGTDPVAVDATGARLMGMDPERIRHLTEAGRFLGQVHLDDIEQRGEDPERVAYPFDLFHDFQRYAIGSSRSAPSPTADPSGR